jgi:hypothetical protein
MSIIHTSTETIRARVRGYGCEYTPGVLTVLNNGHKWKNGTLIGTLVVQLEYTRSLRTIQNIPKVTGKQYGQEEEPAVNEIKELLADLAAAYPLLEELDVNRVTDHHEENGKKWQHIYLEIAPVQSVNMSKPLRVSLGELLDQMPASSQSSFPENTKDTLTPSETRIRPGGKKARKAALQEAKA